MSQQAANPSLEVSATFDESSLETPGALGLTPMAWVKILIVTALMVALFRFNLLRLWLKTNPFTGEANWGHAICVPIIGLYYLYLHREELLKAKVRTAWTGLFIAFLGVMMFGYGIWPGQNDFVKDFGMVVTLMGVVTLLTGWQVMKTAWFPIAFLVCAIPWPGLVYSWLASPLQFLAASVAVFVLRICQIPALHSGTKIIMTATGRTLNVAEACAGLRSLMTFISVGGAVAFLSPRPLWQKLIITAMAVPIAVACNVMRVSGQGILDYTAGAEWSENFAHQFVGLIMLVPAFFLILLVGWVLDKAFIEEAEDNDAFKVQAGKVQTIIRASRPTTKKFEVALPRTKLKTVTQESKSDLPPPIENSEARREAI